MSNATGNSERAQRMLDVAYPILKGTAQIAVKNLADAIMTAPTPETVKASNGFCEEGFRLMCRELFSLHVHEMGHAAVIRHFHPNEPVTVRVSVRPEILDNAVGVAIQGGTCSSEKEITDPFEQACISVAGWAMDHIGVLDMFDKHASGRAHDSPTRHMFALTKPDILAALWLSPKFSEVFPGCNSDLSHLKSAVRSYVAGVLGIPPNASEEEMETRMDAANVNAEQRRAVLSGTTEFLRNAFQTVARIIEREQDRICDEAGKRAHDLACRVFIQTAIISTADDAIRAAGFGVSPEGIKELLATKKPRKRRTKGGVAQWSGD